MITALHTLIYAEDPVAARAFFRDVLDFDSVDTGGGWLIFKTGPSELGVHPTSGTYEGESYSHPLHHSLSLMCDDIEATVAELEAKGARFAGGIDDYGFGRGTRLRLPGAGELLLYEPRHPAAYAL
jgi:catechol 2,3-dioxygenase-like lactoylglutathione lyase family enzyme